MTDKDKALLEMLNEYFISWFKARLAKNYAECQRILDESAKKASEADDLKGLIQAHNASRKDLVERLMAHGIKAIN